MAAGSLKRAALPLPSAEPAVRPLAPPPARVVTLYVTRWLHCTRRMRWLPVSDTRYTPSLPATLQGLLKAAAPPRARSTKPAGFPPARVTAEPSWCTRRSALLPASTTSSVPSLSSMTSVGKLKVTLSRGPSPCPATPSRPAKVTKEPLPSSSAILWLPVSATRTLRLRSCAMPPEQPPPPLGSVSPRPSVTTLLLARCTTRSSAALLTLSVKKSCEALTLMATPVVERVAALPAGPSTVALAPVTESVVACSVAVEMARRRLLAKSATYTCWKGEAAMPMGLKKVLLVAPPSAKGVEPLPPRVKTEALGRMPRMRLLLRSAT